MHQQSVVLLYRYCFNHTTIVRSCRPIRLSFLKVDQPIVRSLCCTLHAQFLAKPLISTCMYHYVCTKPCRQPSHTHRTVVINVLTIAKGTIVKYKKVPYTTVIYTCIGFVYQHSLYMVSYTTVYMVLYTSTRHTWFCTPLYTYILGFVYHHSLLVTHGFVYHDMHGFVYHRSL